MTDISASSSCTPSSEVGRGCVDEDSDRRCCATARLLFFLKREEEDDNEEEEAVRGALAEMKGAEDEEE